MKSSVIVLNVFLHLCFIFFANSIEFDNFYVEKSGHSKVKPGEIAVVFYMTVANSGRHSKKIHSKNIRCCWKHPESGSKYDCESMDLHGGVPVILEPSKTGNITYLFTNLYALDRVGQCVFHLWHTKNKVAHTIRFNTTYQYDEQGTWLGSLYKTIVGDGKKVKFCDTVDLDPHRKCKPVNCVQKYNGKRNFFRKETQLCEPVHECYTSRDDDGLPTTAFDKDHNKCKSLIQKELTKDEERDLKDNVESHMKASEKTKFKNIGPSNPIPVRCNHGKRVGEICVCDDGWKTETSNVPLGDPKFIYNWCNVRIRKKPLIPYKQQKQFMIAGLSLTSITLFVAWLWMIHRYIYPQDDKKVKRKHRTDDNKHILKKTNLFSTSKSTGHFVKNLLSGVKNGITMSNDIEDSANMSLVDQTFIASDPCNSNISTMAQYGSDISAVDTTQDNSSYDRNVTDVTADNQNSLCTRISQKGSSEMKNIPGNNQQTNSFSSSIGTSTQQRSNSLPGQKLPVKNNNATVKQRSSLLPEQISQGNNRLQQQGREAVENQVLKDQSYVTSDEGVVKEPSRIVASRTTRAGSIFTLAGPELAEKRLSISSPITESFTDSD